MTDTIPTANTGIPAYAVGYLRDIDFGPAIVAYLERIDATLDPFGGEFVVHGGHLSPLEDTWDGDLVVIRFPDRQAALDWYASPAYQEILPLRLDHTRSMATVVDGVPAGYRATHKLSASTDDVSQGAGSRP
jgi:uncharacterized protein (DUF1330 family)